MPQRHSQLPLDPSETTPDQHDNDWQTINEIPLSNRSQPGAVLIKILSNQRVRLECTVPQCRYHATLINLEQAQRRALEHASRHQFGPSYEIEDERTDPLTPKSPNLPKSRS